MEYIAESSERAKCSRKKEKSVLLRSLLLLAVLFSTSSVAFGQSSAAILTSRTKGYLCIPNVQQCQAKWNQTQLGILANDPVMSPFTKDLREQVRQRLLEKNLNISISWEDIRHV